MKGLLGKVYIPMFLWAVPMVASGQSLAQPVTAGQAADYVITQVNPHSRVWQNSAGQNVNEIETGMNYWDGKGWAPSNPQFVVSADGTSFVASQIQDPTKLAANINCQGAVTVTTPNKVTLRSTPVAIGLYDPVSGLSAIVATLTNSTAVQIDRHNIVYPRAFVGGGIAASVVYSLPDTASFHQDVVFVGFDPAFSPTNLGFAPSATNSLQIQIITEFFDPPQPLMLTNYLYVEQDPQVRAQMAAPDTIDYTLDFGDYVFGRGSAYTSDARTGNTSRARVVKDFVSVNNRTFLIESVPFKSLVRGLEALPPVGKNTAMLDPQLRRGQKSKLAAASLPRLADSKSVAVDKVVTREFLAKSPAEIHGVGVDYVVTVSSTVKPTLYAADTTYFVSGIVVESSAVTMESAVFKYPTGVSFIQIDGSLTTATTNYRPAIFTAADDNTAGAMLSTTIWSNYTGNPIGSYGSEALSFDTTSNPTLNNLRFCYMNCGIEFANTAQSQTLSVSHIQMVDCATGILFTGNGDGVGGGGGAGGDAEPEGSGGGGGVQTNYLTLTVNNCLMADVTNPFCTSGLVLTAAAYDCTVDTCSNLLTVSTNVIGAFNFTNSILSNVGSKGTLNSLSLSGKYNGFYNSPTFGSSYTNVSSNPYLGIGAGNYYLPTNSPFLTFGTTNIPGSLVAQLAMKTTAMPTTLTNVITNYTILLPAAQRDTNAKALGFHYDPIDYLAACTVSHSAVLVMTNGVALGYYNGAGIMLEDTSQLVSQGSPWSRNYLVYYGLVQEEPINLGGGSGNNDSMVLEGGRTAGSFAPAAGEGGQPEADDVAGASPFAFQPGATPSMYLRLTTICAPTGQTNLINTANPFFFEPWFLLDPQNPSTWALFDKEYPYFANDWDSWIFSSQSPWLYNLWINLGQNIPYYDLFDWQEFVQSTPLPYSLAWSYFIASLFGGPDSPVVMVKSSSSSVNYLTFRDCEIYGSGANWLMNETYFVPTVSLINNVFHRVPFGVMSTAQITSVNNLFYGTTNANSFDVYFQHLNNFAAYSDVSLSSSGWGGTFVEPRMMHNAHQNDVFDGVTVYLDGQVGCNAYLHGAENTNGSVSTRDIWTNITWLSGSLGNYYQASNGPLLHAGTALATNLGLDQYTVLVSSTIEGTNIVSLGYHYATTGYESETNAPVDAPPPENTPPSIVYPVSTQQVVVTGGASPAVAALPVYATGSAPLHYQWSFNATNIAGATSATLALDNVEPANAGTYGVVVTNDFGSAHGTPYVLKVVFQPSIVTAPVSQIVCPGEQVAFEVQATGESPLAYQWSLNSTNIAGATNSSYSITNSTGAGGTYAVNVSNSYGSSNASATLTVVQPTNPIVIISQPTNLSLTAGSTATFNVVVSNNQCDLTYQWFKAGYGSLVGGVGNVNGGQGPNLSLSNVGSNDVGSYSVILTNGYYSVTSTVVTLSVTYTTTAPTISYVNPVSATAQNGGFPVSFSSVFSASNAKDTDGIPVFFEIVSVTNGQLTLDGLPYAGPTQSSTNCLFNAQSVLVWTPATNVPGSGLAAFAIKATDGILFSTNQVEVTIVPTPPVSLVGWGDNEYGSLANGNLTAIQAQGSLKAYEPWVNSPTLSYPTPAIGLNNIIAFSHDPFWQGAAVNQAGNLLEWGCSSAWGIDGEGEGPSYLRAEFNQPIMVLMTNAEGALAPWTNTVNVSLGYDAIYAIRLIGTNRTLWSWGYTGLGALGRNLSMWEQGNVIFYEDCTPQANQITGITNSSGAEISIAQVASDQLEAALALGTDNSVWYWGTMISAVTTGNDANYVYLSNMNSGLPTRQTNFDTGAPVTQIAASASHYMALRSDGTVWEFGYVPRLAFLEGCTGFTVDCGFTNVPQEVPGLPTNVVSIAAGNFYSLALTSNGIVYQWGDATSTFEWTTNSITNAIPVPGLSNIVQISAGWQSFSALDSLGRVWDWGDITFDQSGYPQGAFPGTNTLALPILNPNITFAQQIWNGGQSIFALAALTTDKPTELSAIGLNAQVQLNWLNYPNATLYNVYRSLTNGGPYAKIGSSPTNSYLDTGLNNSTNYYYVVTAIALNAETPQSAQASATPYSPPLATTWPAISNISECRNIELLWNSNANTASYEVFRSTSSNGPYSLIAQTTDLTNVDATAQAGVPYYYYVVAGNGAGYGPPSTTNGPVELLSTCFPTPVITSLTVPTDGEIVIAWTNGTISNLQGFYIESYLYGAPDVIKQPPSASSYFTPVYVSVVPPQDSNLQIINEDSYVYTDDTYVGTIPYLEIWYKVSAVASGQQGFDSVIAGPVSDCADCAVGPPTQVVAIPGNSQVYLEWQAVTNATVYEVQFTNNGSVTTWTTVSSNISGTCFWHTNLLNGTNYSYRIAPETVFVYSNYGPTYLTNTNYSQICSATPLASLGLSSNAPTNFTIQAFPFDSLVYLTWTNLGNPPQYQSFVQRKYQTNSDSTYAVVSTTGYGLAYFDYSVTDGTTYTYKVTAFDSNYNCFSSVTNVTPSATGVLSVVPTAGNGFVKLTWNPIIANSYNIERASQSGGPYNVIEQTSSTSFVDASAQNGTLYYYIVQAVTPFQTTVYSAPVSATPLATLAFMPPQNFTATIGPGQIQLSWSPVSGATSYRLSESLPPDLLLTNTSFTSYVFPVPTNTVNGYPFTFDLVDLNAQGQISANTSVTVIYTNLQNNGVSDMTLSVGGQTITENYQPITLAGPTNLVLTASIQATNANGGTIYFYDYGTVIGSAPGPVAQITWFNVPGGSHSITAQGVTLSSGANQLFGVSSSSSSYSSYACSLTMNVVPPLATYQTSVTDLQLPAPGLPITLSRSYNSQNTNSPGNLGIGWTPSWSSASLQTATNLAVGWLDAGYSDLTSDAFYVAETTSHLITVTLPGGNSVYFAPSLSGVGNNQYGADVLISLNAYSPNQGSLQDSQINEENNGVSGGWQGVGTAFTVDNLDYSAQFTYSSPGGTQYSYGQAVLGGWCLNQITDPNGNSLTYSYDGQGRVTNILHSNGRQVQFAYVTNTSPPGTWINVYDTISATGSSSYPVLRYLVLGNPTNGFLSEVDQFTDRVNGIFNATTYSYGTAAPNANLLTQVFDGRGVLVVSNQYSTNGALTNQYDALLHKSTYSYNSVSAVQQVARSVSGTWWTNTINYTSGGAVQQVLQPITNSGYRGTSYCYDVNGNLITQTDSYGNSQGTTYDYLNRPVGQSDALGNTTSVQLNSLGQPTMSIDANGNSTTNSYDSVGNLTLTQDPTGTQFQIVNASPIAGANSNILAAGLVASSTQQAPGMPYPVMTSYTYYQGSGQAGPNCSGEVQSMTQQWIGNSSSPISTTSYQYDPNGNRTSETTTATVNGTSGTQIMTQYQYDAQNRLVATIDALGRTSSTFFDPAGRPTTNIDVEGHVTTNTYDGVGNLIETGYPDGTVSRMTYDELNHVLYTQDRSVPNGSGLTSNAATLNVYDGAGRVICVERMSGVQLTKELNSGLLMRSNLTSTTYQMVTSANGTMVSFTRTAYDLNSRVQYSVSANGTVTQYNYDADGRRTNMLVYYAYTNNLTNPAAAISPTGGAYVTQYQYDANGNQIAMIDANGNTNSYSFDSANRLLVTTYPQLGTGIPRHQTATAYDGLGNKVRTIDEAGVVTAYTYDFRGLVTSVTLDAGSPGQLVYQYAYDERGNLIRQTDANGHVTQYEYDALSRRTLRMLPDGSVEYTDYWDVPATGYSCKVQETAVTDFRGKTIVTLEDVMGRLATKIWPPINAGETNTTFTYSYTPGGQPAQVQTSVGSTVERTVYYDYDNLNRLIQKDVPEGVLTYTWTPDSHVQSINGYRRSYVAVNGPVTNGTPTDVSLGYAYDFASRLSRVTNNEISTPNVTTYAYDPVGNLTNSTYPGGFRHNYTFNAQNRLLLAALTNGSGSQLQAFSYGLNAVGGRTNALESAGSSVVKQMSYTYDGDYANAPRVNRLTKEYFTNSSGTTEGYLSYGYDQAGNRTNRAVSLNFSPYDSLTNQTFVFDHRDLIDSDALPNNANPNYDPNGNTLIDCGNTTGDLYDAENHLIYTGIGAFELAYDAEGNRVNKNFGSSITYYLVDELNPTGYAQVLAEYTSLSSAPSVGYTYGLGLMSEKASGGNMLYYGYDGQGNVRMLVNGNTVEDTYDYDGYGNLLACTGSDVNNYRYQGQQWDPNLGLYYLRARYYAPKLGRFWTMDTYEGDQNDPLSLHKYLYAEADPVDNDDPTGQYTQGFGYLAEAAIQAIYATDHPGNVILNGKWTRLGGPLAKAFKLKPDIFNTTTKKWAEIKPLSQSGLVRAGASYILYNAAFLPFKYSPDAGWNPSTHSALAGSDRIIFFNAGGIIFYSDAISNVKDVLGLTTIAAVQAYFAANQMTLTEGLISSLTRIRALAIGAQGANVGQAESDVSTGALIDTVGGFAF
jgi:RHS repeat-associated protein